MSKTLLLMLMVCRGFPEGRLGACLCILQLPHVIRNRKDVQPDVPF